MKNYRGSKHVMLDIETLDTTPSAVVLSIGAVAFTMTHEAVHVHHTMEAHLEVLPQLLCHDKALIRTVSHDTQEWWAGQSAAAIDALLNPKASVHPVDAIRELSCLVYASEPDYVWCQGASFDFPILSNMAKAFGMDLAWPFWKERDSRTIISGGDVRRSSVGVPGEPHGALHDCLSQCRALQETFFERGEPAIIMTA